MADTEALIAELKEVTREAHMALKDLNTSIREAKEYVQTLKTAAHVAVDEAIKPEIIRHTEDLAQTVKDMTEKATEGVFARFDGLAAILLGEDRDNKKQGNKSIPELIDRKMGRTNGGV